MEIKSNNLIKLLILMHSKQIVKNQIHRYQATGPIEFEKEVDPTLEVGAESDEHSTAITLAIVLTAFIISPMTECLGPVLELNVSQHRLQHSPLMIRSSRFMIFYFF